MSFYAGYNSIFTDVAVFESATKRDEWVSGKSFFERVPLTNEQANEILGSCANTYNEVQYGDDANKDIIKWLINPINITYIP